MDKLNKTQYGSEGSGEPRWPSAVVFERVGDGRNGMERGKRWQSLRSGYKGASGGLRKARGVQAGPGGRK